MSEPEVVIRLTREQADLLGEVIEHDLGDGRNWLRDSLGGRESRILAEQRIDLLTAIADQLREADHA